MSYNHIIIYFWIKLIQLPNIIFWSIDVTTVYKLFYNLFIYPSPHSTSDFSLVDDSGSELAETFAAKYPFVFNGDAEDTAETPFQSFDGRSDNRVIYK